MSARKSDTIERLGRGIRRAATGTTIRRSAFAPAGLVDAMLDQINGGGVLGRATNIADLDGVFYWLYGLTGYGEAGYAEAITEPMAYGVLGYGEGAYGG